MKRINIYIIAVVSVCLLWTGCDSDDSYAYRGVLEQTIDTAKKLIETTTEGTNEGDFAPGSQQVLKVKIDWAEFILATSASDEAFLNASKILEEDIEIFKDNIVKRGFPLYDAGSYFDLGLLADYDIYTQFTIECQVRFSEWGDALGNIIAAEDAKGGIILRYRDGVVDAYINNGGWLGGSAGGKVLELNTWYHLGFTFSGTTVKLYIDGVEYLSQTTGTALPILAGETLHLHAGANPTYTSRFMQGNIAQVSIWDHARSQAEIQANLQPSYNGNEAGLLAYWPFNINLGTSIEDKTGNFIADGTSIIWQDQ